MQAVCATDLSHEFAIDYHELEASFSRISSCHLSARLGGHTMTAVRARCRKKSSWTTSPASMGLAQAHVVRRPEIRSGTRERSTKWLEELIRLDVRAGPEWSLVAIRVG